MSDAAVAADQARLILVLGGARSGKSRRAVSIMEATPSPWLYVATAEAFDHEMVERIALHRAERGPGWRTVEAPRDLPGAIRRCPAGAPLLVDCLTLWLNNLMLAQDALEPSIIELENVLREVAVRVVLVSNEVGCGIVPENAMARSFRDAQGRLNQRMAALADRVEFVVAGLPVRLK